jgi:hypothetical protein
MVDRDKEEFMSHIEHYHAVIEDLQSQRAMYELKISEIDRAIASLGRLIPAEAKEDLPALEQPANHAALNVPSGKYAGMSVRGAILNLLNEDANAPMETGEIADALQRGGITSAGKSFNSNISAVLSNMSRARHEIQSAENGWVISPIGRQAWAHIRVRRAEQHRLMTSSTVQ